MKESIEELRANVERTEMAGLKFIATRVENARAALDYIVSLEQWRASRAQRTNESECNSAAAPAEGQAGLAKPHENEALRDAVTNGLRGLWGCGRVWSAWNVGTMGEDDFYAADESDECIAQVIEAIAPFLAPVAADTEQASARDIWTLLCEYGEYTRSGNYTVIYEHHIKGIHDRITHLFAPLATPADAGAGPATKGQLTPERVDELFFEAGYPSGGFEYRFAAIIEREVLARLSTPGAPDNEAEARMLANVIDYLVANGHMRWHGGFDTEEPFSSDDEEFQIILDLVRRALPYRSTPGAPVTIEQVAQHIERMGTEFFHGPRKYAEAGRKAIANAVRAAFGQSPAPVTAEPVAWAFPDGLERLARVRDGYADSPLLVVHAKDTGDYNVPLYTHSAPADRDAIRNEVLEEAAKACDVFASEQLDGERLSAGQHCASEVRALKTHPSASPTGEKNQEGGEHA